MPTAKTTLLPAYENPRATRRIEKNKHKVD